MMYLWGWMGLLSLALFFLIGNDKQRAKKRQWRIPEKTLLTLGVLGGGLGGILGMQFFRHKTRHQYFYVVYMLSTGIWIGILIYMSGKLG